MRVFDLHCDTLTKCLSGGGRLLDAPCHISLEKGAALEAWTQVFAVFVPDTLRGGNAAAYCDIVIDYYQDQLDEIQRVCRPILSIENGNALMGDLHRLDELAAKQVKIITLTWNAGNELGYGSQCGPRGGLKPFGREALVRMAQLGIRPDVSHLNEAGFWEVAESGCALLATHANCAAIQPHCRNLSDAQLRAVFESGGLVGLCLVPPFLGGAGAPEDFARHFEHILALGGEKHVALGSDFDGCDPHPALAGLETLQALDEALDKLGFARETREALFWGNAARFFESL